ncbi:transcriptional activator FtrA [Halomonas lysinitropha]|uniref:Transcriptional activator FtrA n=1 Tax=Halomonas lysinitropha TaxID=2607506 RepID=A0A5K1IAP5_9GAMM|nr:helix-turn-helix domain-containing protein [Halomonas lysinitropha]VVZ95029.1 transcriptional activator FtrA [Halomonas lysinitropha]
MAHAAGEPLPPATSEAGWQCRRYSPGVRLNERIGRLQAFAVRLTSPVQLLEPPRGHVALVIGFGNPIHITTLTTPDTEGTYDSFLVGPDHPPLITRHDGERTCFEILLSPCTAYELFGGRTQGLDGQVIPLEAFLGDMVNRLTEQLIVAASWEQRFALLETTLTRHLDRQPWQVRDEIRWAWHCLEQSGGAMPVSELVSALGWSHRHFVHSFQHYTGMTPKAAARYLRLARALACIDQSPEEALAAVALECHYCDQSHLTREFHALAGCTPATYRHQCLGHFLPVSPAGARSGFFKTAPAPSA